ncbi:MAG: hypothetical protein ABIP02_07810 [Arenimonas sp.]
MLLGLGLGIATWLSTVLLTWGWIKFARARQIQDQPERRRLHRSHTPRGGGIGIALNMLVIGVVIYSFTRVDNAWWFLIDTAILLFGLLGFCDDLSSMSSAKKLFLHLISVSIIFLISIFGLSLNVPSSLMIAFGYLFFVNIWNFMDGSNGMIAMQSLLMTIGFVCLSHFTSATYYYSLALAAACLGFLPFNFPVARVFLGDVGSHVLGAALAGLALLAYVENQWTLLEITCLFSALWIDAVLTFIRRGLRGFKVMQAHRSHFYQYAIRTGSSHTAICAYYAMWTISVIVLIGFSRTLPKTSQAILLISTIAVACLIHQCLRIFVLKSIRKQKISNPVSQ